MAPRRRKPRSRWPDIPPAAAILLVLAASIAVTGWARTPSARMLMADRGLPGQQDWARSRIGSTLRDALDRAGVDPDSVVQSRGWAGAPDVVRLQAPGSLLSLNLAVTEAIENVGGRILRGESNRDPGGEWLELRLGTASGMTHRLVARRERVAPVPPPLPAGRLALVLDDLGHNFNELTRRALHLPAPITYAILPDRAQSRRVLTEARRAGRQCLLHMPMEPDPGAPVGPGEPAVRVGMDAAEIRAAVRAGLDALPGVVGLNNHMGSRVTRSRPEMDAVMEVLARRGLVFLDSRTTPLTVAHVAATAQGIPNLRNDLFLDIDTDDPAEIRRRLQRLVRRARERGWAIGIGHVHPATIGVLEEFLPTLNADDVGLVAVSELILDGARQPGF